jgi:spore germination cell wall hydrolase CwlJ-like protein
MDNRNKLDNVVASSWLMKLAKFVSCGIGLAVVAVGVYMVCQYRIDQIKASNEAANPAYTTAEARTRQLDCLTRNIYWEAASEPFEGKVGVAQVTINRWESGRFSDTLCGVVYQKNVFYEKIICQFSWYCENTHKTRPVHKEYWRESEEVAKKVLLENFRLPSLKDAYYYHATYVNPNWNKPRITIIGRHIFYGERT